MSRVHEIKHSSTRTVTRNHQKINRVEERRIRWRVVCLAILLSMKRLFFVPGCGYEKEPAHSFQALIINFGQNNGAAATIKAKERKGETTRSWPLEEASKVIRRVDDRRTAITRQVREHGTRLWQRRWDQTRKRWSDQATSQQETPTNEETFGPRAPALHCPNASSENLMSLADALFVLLIGASATGSPGMDFYNEKI